MTWLARLIGRFLPARDATGASGLPRPALLDFRKLCRPTRPNTALAAPAGTHPAPDLVTPIFHLSADRLYRIVLAVAASQTRTVLAQEYPAARQAHFVSRSAWLNFPDLSAVQVNEVSADSSAIVLYSRSVYGYSDSGVNRRRLIAWLADIQARINNPDES